MQFYAPQYCCSSLARRRDRTTPAVDCHVADPAQSSADGTPAFLEVLRDELLQQAEQRHRADPARRILIGQSRAGYFVLWSALQDPDLFWTRIASNPAFVRVREDLFGAPAAHDRTDLNLVIASGARDADFRMRDAPEWTASGMREAMRRGHAGI